MAFLSFRSDTSVSGSGFELQWSALDSTAIVSSVTADGGGSEVKTAATSTWTTTVVPIGTARWKILVPAGKRIRLVFNSLSLEHHGSCNYDYLKIYDGGGTYAGSIGKFCGYTVPEQLITSGNIATLYFRSDTSVSEKGFELQWSALNGGVSEVTTVATTTLGHPTATVSSVTADGGGSKVKTSAATSTWTKETTGTERPDNVAPTTNSGLPATTTSIWTTETTGTERPDNVAQTTNSACSLLGTRGGYAVHSALSGTIRSPGFPDRYPSRTSCRWKILVPAGKWIRLVFNSFSLEGFLDCTYDYLQIYDGGDDSARSMGKFCGENVPEPLITSGNMAFLSFSSDQVISKKGFELQWSALDATPTVTADGGGSEVTAGTTAFGHPTTTTSTTDRPDNVAPTTNSGVQSVLYG
ncbi:tolloid-like protein 2 [Branchiostoma floridae]|uniref:Tolloid-like protein 2 n=1 Tax=Branchiostoma floridae TaxID=7739 RepID=A0A9J7N649_BRAFL|nr:tolloid-like protein 2 [Branchiostoma floridae]